MSNVTKGVYCLTNIKNGKRYVGIAFGKRGIYRRWNNYKNLNCKDQPKLYNALKKYGTENFKYEVILETDDVDRGKRVEKQLIALWGLQNDKFGYNITSGGDGCPGIKRNSGVNHPMYGKTHTKEARIKISKAGKGRTSPRKGVKLSAELREKLSNAHKGIKFTPERRQKISIAIKEKWKNMKAKNE